MLHNSTVRTVRNMQNNNNNFRNKTKSWLYFSLIREYAYFSRDFLKNKKDLSHQSELAGLRPLPRLTLAHDWS